MLLGVVADIHDRLSATGRQSDARLAAVLAYVRKQSRDRDLTRALVSRSLGLSEFWVAHHLKQATGRSFSGHVNDARMADALKLLDRHEEGVKRIALTVGYVSHHAFTRLFGQRFAMTPSLWRRAQGAGRRAQGERSR